NVNSGSAVCEAKNVFVIGASSSLGISLCKLYSQMGYCVYATYNKNPNGLDKLVGIYNVIPVKLDLLSAELKKDLIEYESIPFEIIINCAGVLIDNDNSSFIRRDEVINMFIVNAISPIEICSALLPSLRLGEKKTVVNISSKLASIGYSYSGGMYAYRGSKSALNSMSKAFWMDNKDLTVLLIHPGWFKSKIGGQLAPEEPETVAKCIVESINKQDKFLFIDYKGHELPW
ncbi:SDR family NAD(P)-dependent oxidoreductase, partial [Vibrio mimicus]